MQIDIIIMIYGKLYANKYNSGQWRNKIGLIQI